MRRGRKPRDDPAGAAQAGDVALHGRVQFVRGFEALQRVEVPTGVLQSTRPGDYFTGTLIPTRDHRLAAQSKNYRYSSNLQVAIDAHTRLVVALGDPQPGNRNDTTVYRTSGIDQKLAGRPVMADGAYRGNPEVIIPYRKPADGSELPDWKLALNKQHRTVRAQVEHALARMKCFKILRDYRRAASTLADTASGIAHLHNIILAG
ncbi:hypothetical protein GCM10022225_84510 [Plantactinospora mayteni]|uniref:DDE Tnp4 domain-containing protein n=1 Tax=Plantactinospora mayteni TaxID=566021 RepID=A0ABQ4F4P3_9ACTN|nr:hypothetical protein Pma05_84630 [Plantactinospora mayteni]